MKRTLIFAIAILCINLLYAKEPANYTYSEVGQTGLLTMPDIMNYVVGLARPNQGMWTPTRKELAKALKPYHGISACAHPMGIPARINIYKFPASYKLVNKIEAVCLFDKKNNLTEYTFVFNLKESGYTYEALFDEIKNDMLEQSIVEMPELSQQQQLFSSWAKSCLLFTGTFSYKFVGYKNDSRYELVHIKIPPGFMTFEDAIFLTVFK